MPDLGATHPEDRTPSAPVPSSWHLVPALSCRRQEADEKEEELEMWPGGFSLDSVQLGLGLALGSDTDKLGDRWCQRLYPSTPHWCLLSARHHLVASVPRPASAWFLLLELPGWWADKGTDCYNTGECLTSPRGQGGLPGGGDVYTQSKKMSRSLSDEGGEKRHRMWGGPGKKVWGGRK